MKRAKKRWAWKPAHKRPCFRQMWNAAKDEARSRRHFWHSFRQAEREALYTAAEDTLFPLNHRHSVAWDRW